MPGSENDLWWNWAIAEVFSRRFGGTFRPYIPAELQAKIRTDRRDALTPRDWDSLRAAVFGFRRPLLQDLLPLGFAWSTGELDPSELPNVRIMNYEPHTRLAPSRTLSAFAEALDSEQIKPGEEGFRENYRILRATFRFDSLQGRPIMVAETTSGSFTLLEGYTRMAVMTSLCRAGEIDSKPIPILLGVCPRVKEWAFY